MYPSTADVEKACSHNLRRHWSPSVSSEFERQTLRTPWVCISLMETRLLTLPGFPTPRSAKASSSDPSALRKESHNMDPAPGLTRRWA
jgi:hypothetical protein